MEFIDTRLSTFLSYLIYSSTIYFILYIRLIFIIMLTTAHFLVLPIPFRVLLLLISTIVGVVCHFSSSKSLSKVESIQRRALRFLHDDNDSSYDDLLTKTGKNLLCIEIFKTINNLNPIYMKDIFQLAISDRPVRQHHTHNLKKVWMRTTTFGTKSLTSLGPIIWNKLPTHLKSAENIVGFRKMIKNWNGEKCLCKLCEGG